MRNMCAMVVCAFTLSPLLQSYRYGLLRYPWGGQSLCHLAGTSALSAPCREVLQSIKETIHRDEQFKFADQLRRFEESFLEKLSVRLSTVTCLA